MRLTRIHNWHTIAVAWATGIMGRPFEWGHTDCAALTVALFSVLYGREIEVAPYRSLREAVNVFEALGGAQAVLTLLGAEQLPTIWYANIGDVLVAPPVENEPFDALMPVVGEVFLYTRPDESVRTAPLSAAHADARAYRLPDPLELPEVFA